MFQKKKNFFLNNKKKPPKQDCFKTHSGGGHAFAVVRMLLCIEITFIDKTNNQEKTGDTNKQKPRIVFSW